MGISFGVLSKLGLLGASSLTTDQIYDRFFDKNITEFKDFHTAFIDLCKFLNDAMPGKHFTVPSIKEVQGFYEGWDKENPEKRKQELRDFLKKKVCESRTDDNAMIMTGLVAPAAAVFLKNSTQNMPTVKRFKLHLIPNFVFVPTFTFVALAGVQLLQINKKSKSEKDQS